MTIYGEYLFIENFLAGYGILKLTGLLCGRKPSEVRVVEGAVFCGGFAFVLLAELSVPVVIVVEVVFACLLVSFVFSPGDNVAAARITGVFFVVSFMLGGSVVAFIYAIGIRGIVSNGILYIGNYGYMLVFAGGAVGVISMMFVADFMRKRAPKGTELMKVTVDIMGNTLSCVAKVDSANYLREPLSGKPVSLIRKDVAESGWKRLFAGNLLDNRIRAVPFKSIGCDSGIMTAIRCDSVTIDRGDLFGRGKIYLRNVYLGLYDGVFDSSADQHYDMLLQPEIINGGFKI